MTTGDEARIRELEGQVRRLADRLADRSVFRELKRMREEFGEDRRAAMEWLEARLAEASGALPGVRYEVEVGRRRITAVVDLPERLELDGDLLGRKDHVVAGCLEMAVRILAVQSGHRDVPSGVSLIPEHPKDEEAWRLIREFADTTKGKVPPADAVEHTPRTEERER